MTTLKNIYGASMHSCEWECILFLCVVAALEIFLKVFLKKHKLYNLIKREIHILTRTIIIKTRKYIKFTIAFYVFSYFEIVAW